MRLFCLFQFLLCLFYPLIPIFSGLFASCQGGGQQKADGKPFHDIVSPFFALSGFHLFYALALFSCIDETA
jgi:hypothetical protein